MKFIKKNNGLSLAELLTVVVIMGVIATISIILIGNIIENAKIKAILADEDTVANIIPIYCIDHDKEPICNLNEEDIPLNLNTDLPTGFSKYISIDFQNYDEPKVSYDDDLGYIVVLSSGLGITDGGYIIDIGEKTNTEMLNEYKDLTFDKLVFNNADDILEAPKRDQFILNYTNNDILKNGELIIKDKNITGAYFQLYLYSTEIKIINSTIDYIRVYGNNITFDNSVVQTFGHIWNDEMLYRWTNEDGDDDNYIHPYKESLTFIDSYFRGTIGKDAYETVEIEQVNIQNSCIYPNGNYSYSKLDLSDIPFHTLNIDLKDGLTFINKDGNVTDTPEKIYLSAMDIFTNDNGYSSIGSTINISGDTGLYIDRDYMVSLNASAILYDTKLIFNITDNSYVALKNANDSSRIYVYGLDNTNSINNSTNIAALMVDYSNIEINIS